MIAVPWPGAPRKHRTAPALAGKAIDLGKAKPRSPTLRLGREIGLEGSRHHLGGHSLAGVHQCDRDNSPTRPPLAVSPRQRVLPATSRKPPPFGIVAGVDRDIEQGEFEFPGIDRHRPQICGQADRHDDVFAQ